jgi:hypothetical protein
VLEGTLINEPIFDYEKRDVDCLSIDSSETSINVSDRNRARATLSTSTERWAQEEAQRESQKIIDQRYNKKL